MIKTKGKYGSEVIILRKIPDWKSNGKTYESVEVEFILTGYVTNILVENLVPQDKVRKEIEGLK